MCFDQVDYLCSMVFRKILFYALIFTLFGCKQEIGLFQKLVFLPEQSWSYSNKPNFKFQIPDTTSSYRVFFILRHTDAYEYSNIWITLSSKLPGDSNSRSERFNIPLANETQWLGTGMDDIFDHRILLYPQPVRFKKPGEYAIELGQDMRVDPLPHVMNVGLRLEKVN